MSSLGRWFRFYDDTLNDPKSLKLSDKTFRIWVGLLCAASKNDGILPPFEDLLILLRIRADKLQPAIEELIAGELIDHDDSGMHPHNWNTRQYKSDVSTDRVKRFRNEKRNVAETPPETEADTEDKTEQKEKIMGRSPKATRPDHPQFAEFKKAYPNRKGANPWSPASDLFSAAIKSGVTAEQMIGALKAGVGFDRDKIGTEFIPRAMQWLKERRYRDYNLNPVTVVMPGVYVAADTPQMDAWLLHERTGKKYPRDRNGGWHFPSEWPPGHQSEAA